MVLFGVRVRAILSVAMLVAAGAVFYSTVVKEPPGSWRGETHSGHTRVYPMESLHAFDVRDENKLVGFAENVFVGRVLEKTGSEAFVGPVQEDADSREGPPTVIPRTQFSVEVLDNIKGQLENTVTVSQTGGAIPGKDGIALLNEDPLLRSGQTVLFTTRFDEKEGRHQITTSNYGDVRIGGAEERARVVERFETARKNQVDPLSQIQAGPPTE